MSFSFGDSKKAGPSVFLNTSNSDSFPVSSSSGASSTQRTETQTETPSFENVAKLKPFSFGSGSGIFPSLSLDNNSGSDHKNQQSESQPTLSTEIRGIPSHAVSLPTLPVDTSGVDGVELALLRQLPLTDKTTTVGLLTGDVKNNFLFNTSSNSDSKSRESQTETPNIEKTVNAKPETSETPNLEETRPEYASFATEAFLNSELSEEKETEEIVDAVIKTLKKTGTGGKELETE